MFVSRFDRKHCKEIQFLRCKEMVVIFRHLLDKTRLYASYLVDVHHESRRFHNVFVPEILFVSYCALFYDLLLLPYLIHIFETINKEGSHNHDRICI